jgi:hypothetical protein
MARKVEPPPQRLTASADGDVAQFLAQLDRLRPPHMARGQAHGPASGNGQHGRLIMAMDATLSRQLSWDLASRLQAQMFEAVAAIGGLSVQLVYFRGADECRASRWVDDAQQLTGLMDRVRCQGGMTQIKRVLDHAMAETATAKVNALVYVGDCCEEGPDLIAAAAAQLGLAGIPVFLFQEGSNARATQLFAEIARLTRGAHCRFDPAAADTLAQLLRAVAVYATGGQAALAELATAVPAAQLMLTQLSPGS